MGEYLKFAKMAIDNVNNSGDTDIFPFPLENHIFFDTPSETLKLLEMIHLNFDDKLEQLSPVNYSALCPVGYSGFRWATQIEPIWNLYFLSLVLWVAEDIEKVRIKTSDNTIHSYRYKFDSSTGLIFNSNYSWSSFQISSLEKLKKDGFVLLCDISDFYPRIYHHSLENALKRATTNTEASKRIISILQKFSDLKSYGLPVGGPASRILSELLLSKTDQLLQMEGYSFCRYADDYHIFIDKQETAYEALVFISKKLQENEGLSIQKQKTRIISTEEFRLNSEWFSAEESGKHDSKRTFLQISLKYDPYSPTADEDYESLKAQIKQFDIVGMLASEMKKSRVHSPIMKKLLAAIKLLDKKNIELAVETLLESVHVLAPVFPLTMIVLSKVFDEVSSEVQSKIINHLVKMIRERHYLIRIDLNLHFVVRVLGKLNSDLTENILNELYKSTNIFAIKRDILLIFAKWGNANWVSDKRNQYQSFSVWEKRAFLVATYMMGDEGKHWRDHNKSGLSDFDLLYKTWAEGRKSKNLGLAGVL